MKTMRFLNVTLLALIALYSSTSWAEVSLLFQSPGQAEFEYYNGGSKMEVSRDGTLIRTVNDDQNFGTLSFQHSPGAHTYSFAFFGCDEYEKDEDGHSTNNCISFRLGETIDISTNDYTQGTVTTDRVLTGDQTINNAVGVHVCPGVRLTFKDANVTALLSSTNASIRTATNDNNEYICSNYYENDGLIPAKWSGKVTFDHSTLTNIWMTGVNLSVNYSHLNLIRFEGMVAPVWKMESMVLSEFSNNTSNLQLDYPDYDNYYSDFYINASIYNDFLLIENNQMPFFGLYLRSPNKNTTLIVKNNQFERFWKPVESWLSDNKMGKSVTLQDNIIIGGGIRTNAENAVVIKDNQTTGEIDAKVNTPAGGLFISKNKAERISVQDVYDNDVCPTENNKNWLVINNQVERSIYSTCGVIIKDNVVGDENKKSDSDCIYLKSGHNEVIGNRLYNCQKGILTYSSDFSSQYNLIRDNIISGVTDTGVLISESNNTVFNNFFLLTTPYTYGIVYSDDINQRFHTDKTAGKNIVGGPYLGGNYYANYTGYDENKDGFIDEPYAPYAYPGLKVIKDELPLYLPLLVNRADDLEDSNLMDGRCDIDEATEGNQCTLRAAIESANLKPDGATILFAIPDTSVIQIKKALPALVKKIHIKGETQPNLEINGQAAGEASGLIINSSAADDSMISGLKVRYFSLSGIDIRGAKNVILQDVESSFNSQNGIRASLSDSDQQLKMGGIKALDNGHYGIYLSKGSVTLNQASAFGNSVNNNKYGGIYLESGTFSANQKLEVVSNGSAKGDSGHGIWAIGVNEFFPAIETEQGSLLIQGNAGTGIAAQGKIVLNGSRIDVVANGKGIVNYGISDITLGDTWNEGSVINVSQNKGVGIYAAKDDISIGNENRANAYINNNGGGGIFAQSGNITARILEVVGNSGVGIQTPLKLEIMVSGKVCNNSGGDMLIGGTTTLSKVTLCDGDGDGASDDVENRAPNNGDMNRDGIPDRFQKHVAVVKDDIGGEQMAAFEADGNAVIISQAHSEYNQDKGGSIYGLTLEPQTSGSREKREFTAGSTTTVTLWLPEGVKPTSYAAYGPTADNATPHWYEFLYDGTTGAELQDDKIILHFADGGRGDSDLTANGKIVHEGHHAAGDFQSKITINGVAQFGEYITADENALFDIQFLLSLPEEIEYKVYAAVFYYPLEGNPLVLFRTSDPANPFVAYSGEPMPMYSTERGKKTVPINFYQGNLTGLLGRFDFHIGYEPNIEQASGKALIYNALPYTLELPLPVGE